MEKKSRIGSNVYSSCLEMMDSSKEKTVKLQKATDIGYEKANTYKIVSSHYAKRKTHSGYVY